MADSEFEEFRHVFERLPQHIKAPAQSYTLVHDVYLDEDSPTSPKSDPCGDEDSLASLASLGSLGLNNNPCTPPPPLPPPPPPPPLASLTTTSDSNANSSPNANSSAGGSSLVSAGGAAGGGSSSSDGSGGGGSGGGGGDSGPESVSSVVAATPPPPPPWATDARPAVERRPRRRLPEIPKNKRLAAVATRALSLADELGEALERSDSPQPPVQFAIGGQTRPLLVLKCHSYLRDEDSSPDSERFHSTDVDSGNSTAHSPDGPKSSSPPPPLIGRSPSPASPASPASAASSGGTPFPQLELLEATHRGLHKFIPRHIDEIEVEIGDPIYVQKEADDLWCEGVNLRSGLQGIFPSAYAVDVDYSDFDPSTPKVKRERYLLGYLGSVETRCHKGNSVLCQAVRKIVGSGGGTPALRPHACILEVSDQGLRMVDRRKPAPKDVPCHDYFYSLKNVSFCAFHPRDHRYMGFITKHPQLQRFACHVFVGQESTRPVAEAVGRAFQRFYTKFIETAYPIEDIYIE